MINNRHTLVLNSNYVPIGIIDSRTAFMNVYAETVDLVSTYKDETFSSPNAQWAIPSIIRTKRYVKLPYHRAILTKRNVFKRDGHKCVYCGKEGSDASLTWDHIIPKSRKGKNTWENLVTSCFRCNNEKDNMTPDEMGWETPKAYQPHYLVVLNSFIKNTPPDWQPYLMVGT